jgi:hypothetical protein
MIGELLIAARTITQDQLDQALREQRRTGALLGDVLVSMQAISQDTLARTLAQEARVPFASLEGAEPDTHAAALVPEALARRGMFVPVSPRSASRVRIAQANPFDVVAIDELQRAIAMPVEVVCAPKDAIARLLDRAYGPGTGHRLQPLVDRSLASLGDWSRRSSRMPSGRGPRTCISSPKRRSSTSASASTACLRTSTRCRRSCNPRSSAG